MLAGLRRQRINAVDPSKINNENLEYNQRTGRPSKGGELMRAKRYYAKNQMLNLRKGKMRRYHAKVKEIISEHNYNSKAVKNDLDKVCELYYSQSILETDITKKYLLYALDYAREDGYLSFLNEESLSLVKANSNVKFDKASVQLILQNLAAMHARRFYYLTVLWSAYVLLYHVENRKIHKSIMNDVTRIDKIKEDCLECYTLELGHLTNDSDDDIMYMTNEKFGSKSYIKEEEADQETEVKSKDILHDNHKMKVEEDADAEEEEVVVENDNTMKVEEEFVDAEEEFDQEIPKSITNEIKKSRDPHNIKLELDDSQISISPSQEEQVVRVEFKAPLLHKRPIKHSKKKKLRSALEKRLKRHKKHHIGF